MAGVTLRVIAALLDYPHEGIGAYAGEAVAAAAAEKWLSAKTVARLRAFADYAAAADLMDLQEEYVGLFDRTPSLALHLFEHVHGDSRDRGQALLELDALYREIGLENMSEHTPDYLPMFLEYLSLLPVAQARDNLDGVIDIVAILRQRLEKRGSAYALLLEALEEAATRRPDAAKLDSALKLDSGLPLSADQMDKAWEEQFAFDDMKNGEGNQACPKAEEMLARINMTGVPGEERP